MLGVHNSVCICVCVVRPASFHCQKSFVCYFTFSLLASVWKMSNPCTVGNTQCVIWSWPRKETKRLQDPMWNRWVEMGEGTRGNNSHPVTCKTGITVGIKKRFPFGSFHSNHLLHHSVSLPFFHRSFRFFFVISVHSRSAFHKQREWEWEIERHWERCHILKRRALHFHRQGLSPPAIVDALPAEGMKATRQGIAKMLKHVERTGSLARCPGSGRPSSITPAMKAVVDVPSPRWGNEEQKMISVVFSTNTSS